MLSYLIIRNEWLRSRLCALWGRISAEKWSDYQHNLCVDVEK